MARIMLSVGVLLSATCASSARAAELVDYRFLDSLTTEIINGPQYGLAVGADGTVFISAISGDAAVKRYEPGAPGPEVLVERGTAAGQLPSASSLALGPDGLLYAASVTPNTVFRINAQTGAVVDEFLPAGSPGTGSVLGLTFGPDKNLYLASRTNDAVYKFAGSDGAFLGEFVASGGGGLDAPNMLTFGPDGNLYVTSSTTNSVLRYNGASGDLIDEFVMSGSGGLNHPHGIAFGPDGHLYVSSRNSGAVMRYDGATGAFLDRVADIAALDVHDPRGLAFDGEGRLLVAGSSPHYVVRFEPWSAAKLANPGVQTWEFEATIVDIDATGPFFDALRLGDTIRGRISYDVNTTPDRESTPGAGVFVHADAFVGIVLSIDNSRTGESYAFAPFSEEDLTFPLIAGVGSETIEGESLQLVYLTQLLNPPPGLDPFGVSAQILFGRSAQTADSRLPTDLNLDDWPVAEIFIPEEFFGEQGLYAQIVSLTPVESPAILADGDADGDVDGADFLIWQRGVGEFNSVVGDFDRSARTNEVDLAFWELQFAALALTPARNRPLPEPSSRWLVLFTLLSGSVCRGFKVPRPMARCQT